MPSSEETYADDDRLTEMSLVTPIGRLRIIASRRGLVAVLWPDDRAGRVRFAAPLEGSSDILDEAAAQIAAYFDRRLRRFDVPLDLRGTPFQQSVWRALTTIPYGETRSYRDLANAIGQPSACRAVGAANGRNPLSIIVPCHRVIGSAGSLTGFAGGLAVKHHLLTLEGALAARLL